MKGMATHSSTLAWRIPWTEEPGGLQSMEFKKCWTRLSDGTTTTTGVEKIQWHSVASQCTAGPGTGTGSAHPRALCKAHALAKDPHAQYQS